MPTILVHPASFDLRGGLDEESYMRLRKGFQKRGQLIKEGFLAEEIYFVSSVRDRLVECLQSQSEMIERWLIIHGVNTGQIFISNESSNTLDDIRNSARLVRKNNLPEPVINVSSWYHIPRIWLMWLIFRKKLGLRAQFVMSRSVLNVRGPWEELKKIRKILQLFGRR